MNNRWVLPEGIEEVLPPQAQQLERLRRQLLDLFATWGYELVMPPLIEYVESLLTGTGTELDLQTFKITDQLTGRLMGVRPDITPQAARLDAHYLKRQGPTRLCYAGTVLHTRPGDVGGSREPLQVGAEIFGHTGVESDAEVLALMVNALQALGFADAHVDLGHVGVFRALARAAALNAELEARAFEALQRKSVSQLQTLLASSGVAESRRAPILALLDLSGGEEVLTRARERLSGNAEALAAVANLQAIAERAKRTIGVRPLYFDLAELSGYHYYTGAVFSAFVPGVGRAIAKGGRYDGIGCAFGRDRAATGFGCDLRALHRLMPEPTPDARGVLAPMQDEVQLMQEISKLRAAGERVVVNLGAAANVAELGCDRRLVKKGANWVVETI